MDISHIYGNDLVASPSGDLSLAAATDYGVQRVYRRLLTNPAEAGDAPDYTWHPDYGAGVPRKVGQAVNIPVTAALIKGQMLLENAVARDPGPQVILRQAQNVVSAAVRYADANSAAPQLLSFDISV